VRGTIVNWTPVALRQDTGIGHKPTLGAVTDGGIGVVDDNVAHESRDRRHGHGCVCRRGRGREDPGGEEGNKGKYQYLVRATSIEDPRIHCDRCPTMTGLVFCRCAIITDKIPVL
jgi:hypothetical protein